MSEAKKTTSNGAEEYSQETTNAIQRDLEAQLRRFSNSVADGVVNGFDGDVLGAQAKGVGNAFVRAAASEFQTAAKKQWSMRFKKKPSADFEKCARSRGDVGVLQIVFGSIFGLLPLLAAFICVLTGVLVGDAVGLITVITGVSLLPLGLPFGYMFLCGLSNVKLSKRLKHYVQCLSDHTSIPLTTLAEDAGSPVAVVQKDIYKIKQRGWCPLWLEEGRGVLHLTVEAYRAARDQQATTVATAQAAAPQAVRTGGTPLLQSVASFIELLGKQIQVMQDPEAEQELARMQETCRDIYDWLKLHPESASKMRRFSSYYMPTTMKLLCSYNDVQGQQGENAQSIRQDIARFLHTLNTAFDNLHDSLLSAASMDVSAEIAALQGMLAQDGLSTDAAFGTSVSFD